ncbi:MAG: LysR family transcriptional regulator [Ruminococcus sp.]|nr:LysR family transcriptional regulator [Ruminococcus sp.]
MEFKHIEYFIETAKYKSISKAAEGLFISQQALSRCIQNLETELDCKLFERTVKGSVLTESGKTLYDKFFPIVEQYRNTEEEIFAALSNRSQTLSFACVPSIFRVLDTDLLFEFEERYPNITLDRKEMSGFDADNYVKEDSKHFGLIAIPENRHGMRFKYLPIKTLPIMLCVHKDDPLAQQETVSFGQLKDKNFLMFEKRSHFHNIIADHGKKHGFKPKGNYVSSDINQIFNLVNKGKGVFISPPDESAKMLFKNIRMIPFDDDTLTYCIAFVFKDYDRLSPTAKRFMDFIKENTV